MAKKSNSSDQLEQFLQFLEDSPTAWHAVENLRQSFNEANYIELTEGESWKLLPGKNYFVQRNGSSLLAFKMPSDFPKTALICGSHTDSPGLKLKPNAEFVKENLLMLSAEVYGAPLLSSWLNRDLGIAGRAIGLDAKGKIKQSLINLKQFPAIIPQLAIHLDRKVNDEGLILNKQEHLAAIYGRANKNNSLEKQILQYSGLKSLLSHDLFLYPLEKPQFSGLDNAFISSYRLDSLASVHAISEAFLKDKHVDRDNLKIAAFWDNEEIGSATAQGADSPFLSNVLERIYLAVKGSREDYLKMIAQSMCVSIDLTHAFHPNYTEKAEPNHRIYFNGGIALKTHASHAYATNALTAAKILKIAKDSHIPVQHFVSRNDIRSGTTIGPIHASVTGMPTVDIGIGQLSMHSVRELIASDDYLMLAKFVGSMLM